MIDFGTASVYDEKRIQKDISDRIKDIRARYKPDDHPKEELFGREDDKKQRATFVGTAEYVSPELLDEDICQGPADLWALGCIIFKLFTGKTPFYDNSEYLVFNNIKSAKFQMDDVCN
jgi:3-phosphoinositide dependent protein kinase-1